MQKIHDEIQSSIVIRHVSWSRHIEFGSLSCDSFVLHRTFELDERHVSATNNHLVCECVCALERDEAE